MEGKEGRKGETGVTPRRKWNGRRNYKMRNTALDRPAFRQMPH